MGPRDPELDLIYLHLTAGATASQERITRLLTLFEAAAPSLHEEQTVSEVKAALCRAVRELPTPSGKRH